MVLLTSVIFTRFCSALFVDRFAIIVFASDAGYRNMPAFLSARGAPPPLALARRLRASLGPQALLSARGAPPPLAPARRRRASRLESADANPHRAPGALRVADSRSRAGAAPHPQLPPGQPA